MTSKGVVYNEDGSIRLDAQTSLPVGELEFRASRAGGPGGQHVNTSSTRVEVCWSLDRTSALTPDQKARARRALASRLDSEGELRVVAADTRSQLQNRGLAIERLVSLLRNALVVPKVRRATKPTKASKVRRLDAKKQQGERKRNRRVRDDD